MAQIKPKDLKRYLDFTLEQGKKVTFKRWQSSSKKILKEEILDHISVGKSPVAGGGKYKAYSKSYKKQIKNKYKALYNKAIRPVNLKLSGRMLKSLAAKNTLKGISVFFTSGIMKYHNGQGRVNRYTLPVESGQKFRREIKQRLAKEYRRLFKL